MAQISAGFCHQHESPGLSPGSSLWPGTFPGRCILAEHYFRELFLSVFQITSISYIINISAAMECFFPLHSFSWFQDLNQKLNED